MAGFAEEAPADLSEAALTQIAGPGSGRSRVVLCMIAQIRTLWACSVAGVARRKLSVRSLNSAEESSPEAIKESAFAEQYKVPDL